MSGHILLWTLNSFLCAKFKKLRCSYIPSLFRWTYSSSKLDGEFCSFWFCAGNFSCDELIAVFLIGCMSQLVHSLLVSGRNFLCLGPPRNHLIIKSHDTYASAYALAYDYLTIFWIFWMSGKSEIHHQTEVALLLGLLGNISSFTSALATLQPRARRRVMSWPRVIPCPKRSKSSKKCCKTGKIINFLSLQEITWKL